MRGRAAEGPVEGADAQFQSREVRQRVVLAGAELVRQVILKDLDLSRVVALHACDKLGYLLRPLRRMEPVLQNPGPSVEKSAATTKGERAPASRSCRAAATRT